MVDLEGVGENLQDHLAVGVSYFCTQPVSAHGRRDAGESHEVPVPEERTAHVEYRRGWRIRQIASKSRGMRSGISLAPVHYVDHGFAKPGGHGFSLGPTLLTPLSRGRITLRSADPLEAPAIDPGYLSDPPIWRR